MSEGSSLKKMGCCMVKGLDALQAIFALGARIWIFKVFFMSGLTKIQSWESTLALFEYEYAVPLLPHKIAAYLATGAELVLPALLLIGLLSRFSAFGLFILNAVAVMAYADISIAGIKDHVFWGFMLAYLVFHSAGKLSLDAFIVKKQCA